MIIHDKIYGNEEIKEKVLIDLINSEAVQRLKKISQQGLPQEYYHYPVFSRYEHSMGVLILLRRLNASIKEQIAGLIHDVSHTTFSHIIDWAIGDNTKEDYQDKIHSKMIENSDIPNILKKYNIDCKEVSNNKNFSLLEREIPSLCVDRFDYSIREIKQWVNPNIVDFCVDNLINKKGQLVFKSAEAAEAFAKSYMRCQIEHWAGNEAKTRFYLFSKILKKALSMKIISMDDIKKTDDYVIGLLYQSNNKEVLEEIKLLKGNLTAERIKQEGIKLTKKLRYVDPEVLINNKTTKLSEIMPEYRQFIDKFLDKAG